MVQAVESMRSLVGGRTQSMHKMSNECMSLTGTATCVGCEQGQRQHHCSCFKTAYLEAAALGLCLPLASPLECLVMTFGHLTDFGLRTLAILETQNVCSSRLV